MQDMTNCTHLKQKTRAGYSLVEVTLALLVVAIGLTATFALFPEGLKLSRASVDDTEISMFAEYVFTTLDLTAAKYPGGYRQGGPSGGVFWNVVQTDDFISLMLSDKVPTEKFELRASGDLETFYWIPDFYGMHGGAYDSSNFEDYWTSAFTYILTLEVSDWKGFGSGATTYVLLKVWPGEFPAGVTPKGEPRIFYREILPLR
jgi:hypothetical protein